MWRSPLDYDNPPYQKKAKNKRMIKLWIKVAKVAKVIGCLIVQEKGIMGLILNTNENDEDKEGKLFIPHLMRIETIDPKWPYLFTQPYNKR